MSPKRCNTSSSRVSTTSLGAATSNYIQSRKDIEFFPSSLSIFTPTTLDLNPGTQEPSCFIKRVQLSLCRRSSPKSRLAWASAHDVSSCGRSLCGDGCTLYTLLCLPRSELHAGGIPAVRGPLCGSTVPFGILVAIMRQPHDLHDTVQLCTSMGQHGQPTRAAHLG